MSTDSHPKLPVGGFPLPTLDHLGVKPDQLPTDPTKAREIATNWFSSFTSLASSGSEDSFNPSSSIDTITQSLFYHECYWRDILALTWDFRTFTGPTQIKQFLTDRLSLSKLKSFQLQHPEHISLTQPFPDMAWIQFMFSFTIGDVGIGSGVGRLIPTTKSQTQGGHTGSENGNATAVNGGGGGGGGVEWKCHCMFTHLEDLQGFPEKIGPLRDHLPNHGLWVAKREKEAAFEDKDPVVLIIGGSQSGLTVAARLKMLDVPTLIVDKLPRIGDNWRNRYNALCLHDPCYYGHLPYLPFPPNWPEYTPSVKLAGWLEAYAEFMELNFWTSSTVTKAHFDPSTKTWQVHVRFDDDTSMKMLGAKGQKERILNVKHVVFATGFGAGEPNIPKFVDQDKFKGQILHSAHHKRGSDHAGKKVVVIGSSTSAHDIASDYHYNDVDVTMVQRGPTYIMTTKNGWKVMSGLFCEGGPPTDMADRIQASFPFFFGMNGMLQRSAKKIAELDQELLDNLAKVGFKLTQGPDNAGFAPIAGSRNSPGGYYLDVGTSQLIVDRKIKLKSDSEIDRFTESGVLFKDGTELKADVVVLATGFGDFRSTIWRICDEESGRKCRKIWGLDDDGELKGCYRDLGVPGLWYMTGGLQQCRFYSKHIALQIKAMEQGVFGERYQLKVEDPTK
ncbi:FAD/NAD(P)-binding domain-containing protein [Dendrothele bispora CBS 962.96]|uniref:FAD/NAD(P)-binding domain-containing protein n=1 Tax=Dendrothele bispora (strain CBS 962.96) TaxID=1314807 RepID=A0A4S8L6Y4_DENBC|nr:FAD/NAD(P)-binding domain-containing protein [Dendrothele bispora CBS 962.96]